MKHTFRLAAFLAILTITACSNAQKPYGDRPQRQGPPPEAFEACESKAIDDACTVLTPRGELDGTCQMPQGEELVCAPVDRP